MKKRVYPIMLTATVMFSSCGRLDPMTSAPSAETASSVQTEAETEAPTTSALLAEEGVKEGNVMAVSERESENKSPNEIPYVEYPEGAELEHYEVSLYAEPTEVMTNESNGVITFMAETKGKLNEIQLINADTGETVSVLFDGNDGIAGDGQFKGTCRIDLDYGTDPDVSEQKEFNFCALMPDGTRSEVVTVKAYEPITEKEFSQLETIHTAVNAILDSDEYKTMSIEERKEAVGEVLRKCEEEGLIIKDTIRYTESSAVYYYKANGGIGNVISLRDLDNCDR